MEEKDTHKCKWPYTNQHLINFTYTFIIMLQEVDIVDLQVPQYYTTNSLIKESLQAQFSRFNLAGKSFDIKFHSTLLLAGTRKKTGSFQVAVEFLVAKFLKVSMKHSHFNEHASKIEDFYLVQSGSEYSSSHSNHTTN